MTQTELRRWCGQMPIEESAVAAVWAAEGFSCGCWIDPPGRTWLDFVHDHDERILLKAGALHVTIEDWSAELQPGDEVLIPAGARHSVRNYGPVDAVWYYGYRRAV